MPPSSSQPIDIFAASLPKEQRDAISSTAATSTEKREHILHQDYEDPDTLRRLAGEIKAHTLQHLDAYLERAEKSLKASGAHVHFATNANSARSQIHSILSDTNATRIINTKSLATEEIHLPEFLKERNLKVVEPLLGEFADATITGADFVSAETGRIVLATNEGDTRFATAATPLHIALIGIESIVPRDRDLSVFLNLLARSATGQQLHTSTQFFRGSRAADQPSGAKEFHVVFMDNGRTEVLASETRDILRCIHCGACQDVCPVYRQASHQAYRSTYSGPVGAILTPLLAGENFAEFSDLPKASTLCGACQTVCPVDIPLPNLLLRLRNKAHNQGLESLGSPDMTPLAALATRPDWWRKSLIAGKAINPVPDFLLRWGSIGQWTSHHKLNHWKGGNFRNWLKTHQESQLTQDYS